MAAPQCKAPAVADWHFASKPIEDADVEHLAQVLLGTVRSVDLYKGAGWLMDTTAARVLFYAVLPFPWADKGATELETPDYTETKTSLLSQ